MRHPKSGWIMLSQVSQNSIPIYPMVGLTWDKIDLKYEKKISRKNPFGSWENGICTLSDMSKNTIGRLEMQQIGEVFSLRFFEKSKVFENSEIFLEKNFSTWSNFFLF